MSGCNEVFTPTSGSQKYCNNCKDIAKQDREKIQWRNQSRKRNNYVEFTRNCKFCGVEFITYYKNKTICGSLSCEKSRLKKNNLKAEKKRNIKKKYITKSNQEKKRINDLKIFTIYLNNYNYNIIDSSNYINSHVGKLLLECPEGHKWYSTVHNFKDNNNRCFICYSQNNYTSKFEQSVREYIKNIYDGNILYNNREVVFNEVTGKYLELDIYLPDINKAIECDGEYWHSRKDMIFRDKIKDIFCADNNINLLRISDKSWYRDECFDLITNFVIN
jgi:hypothetical protein